MRILSGVMGMGIAVACGLSLAGEAPKARPAEEAALQALEGAVAYSHKAPYSRAVSDLYLGYDAAGRPKRAVVLRRFKTYEKVTAMVVVREQDGEFFVERAEIPDADVITKSAKRKRVTDAITSLQGRKVRNAAGDVSGIDAVTGATRYHARIYASFDLMVRAALKEMDADPEWPRTALTTP